MEYFTGGTVFRLKSIRSGIRSSLMPSAKKLTDQEANKYLEAGRVAKRIRADFPAEVTEGKRLLDFVEELEGEIIAQGCKPAFPCNIGINEVGAHYTPTPSDPTEFSSGDLVKVDFGLHLDGYIVDTAFSVALSSVDRKLVDAVNQSLHAVVQGLKVGDRVSEVGRLVDAVSQKQGFKVIENLQGHEIRRYVLHAGLSVPNVRNLDNRRFSNGMVVAIEPFMTYDFGGGRVRESTTTTIYKAPNGAIEGILPALRDFHGLPICERWMKKAGSGVTKGELEKLRKYPVLVEEKGAPVAQAETTLLFHSGRVTDLVS